MGKSVLVVAAHADDEVLGCGATIKKHVDSGDQVTIIFMTDGVGSRSIEATEAAKRNLAKEEALEVLGVGTQYQFDFPDNAMDLVPLLEVVKGVESVIDNIKPQIIYTHFHADLNVDHRICFDAVMTATRPVPNQCVKEIYGFEVLSSTEWQIKPDMAFKPQMYVDVSDCFEAKITALKAYNDEMRDNPHSRSFEHVEVLGKHRGYSVGVKYAEAFMAYRILKDVV